MTTSNKSWDDLFMQVIQIRAGARITHLIKAEIELDELFDEVVKEETSYLTKLIVPQLEESINRETTLTSDYCTTANDKMIARLERKRERKAKRKAG